MYVYVGFGLKFTITWTSWLCKWCTSVVFMLLLLLFLYLYNYSRHAYCFTFFVNPVECIHLFNKHKTTLNMRIISNYLQKFIIFFLFLYELNEGWAYFQSHIHTLQNANKGTIIQNNMISKHNNIFVFFLVVLLLFPFAFKLSLVSLVGAASVIRLWFFLCVCVCTKLIQSTCLRVYLKNLFLIVPHLITLHRTATARMNRKAYRSIVFEFIFYIFFLVFAFHSHFVSLSFAFTFAYTVSIDITEWFFYWIESTRGTRNKS